MFSGELFMNVFKMLPLTDIIEHYSFYLDGYYAKDWQNDLTWKEYLAGMIESVMRYIMIFMYIILYTNADKNKPFLHKYVDGFIFLLHYHLQ